MCVDPGGREAILSAGDNGGPSPPGGGEDRKLVSDSVEEVRYLQDVGGHGGRVRHNNRAPLCTEYVSSCVLCAIICYNLDQCNREPYLTVSICFRRINHMAVKNHLHSSSGVHEVVSGTTENEQSCNNVLNH